jgi:hypothetical protein
MKTYTLDLSDVQRQGQTAVEAVLNDALNRKIITKSQWESLQKSVPIAQVHTSMLERFRDLLGFQEPTDASHCSLIWMVYRRHED